MSELVGLEVRKCDGQVPFHGRSLVRLMSGSSAAKFTEGLINDLARSARVAGAPPNVIKDANMNVKYSLFAETHPETLRPRHTRSEKRVTFSDADGTHTDLEIHDVEWDWTHATGCKKRR